MSRACIAGVFGGVRSRVSHPPANTHLFVRFCHHLCCEIVHIERKAKTNSTPPTVPTHTKCEHERVSVCA